MTIIQEIYGWVLIIFLCWGVIAAFFELLHLICDVVGAIYKYVKSKTMKPLLLAAILFLCGCGNDKDDEHLSPVSWGEKTFVRLDTVTPQLPASKNVRIMPFNGTTYVIPTNDFRLENFNGCDYVIYSDEYKHFGIVHAGNCKNPEHKK